MRRILSVFLFFLFAMPIGVSLSGCSKGNSAAFCNSSGALGPRVGQVQNIALQPQVGGISLQYAQTGSVTTPTATDCQNNTVTVSSYTYKTVTSAGSTGQVVADVNPTTGALCAGQWNRNSAGGVPDYTFCTSTGASGTAELTAAANGATSNKVLIYVHPQITSIQLGSPSSCALNSDGTLADPATNCFCGTAPNGVTLTAPNCYSATSAITTTALNSGTCLSFNNSGQLVARFYDGDTSVAANNITNIAGHATYAAQTAGLLTFNNDTGVATALAPGTTVVTATIAGASSTAGTVSVCPPKTITITTPNTTNGTVTVNPNNTEPITATVTDAFGTVMTGLTLTYTSTTPVSAPATSTGITPVFPGTAEINAYCLPPTCNPSPFGNVGYLGTGKPVASNTITSTTPGSNSSRIWIASTDSTYIVPVDLTTSVVPTPSALPYVPNSMVISQNGSSIFMGSSVALMTYSTATNAIATTDTNVQGQVLAVSPDSATVVLTDPSRKLVYIYNTTTPAITSSFAGVGTRAAFTPDGGTVYITTNDNHLLVYSTFTSWSQYDLSPSTTSPTGANDVAVTVPAVGGVVVGDTGMTVRSYCPDTTGTSNNFYPQGALITALSPVVSVGDRVASTNDGKHLLDVRLPSAGGTPVMNDITFATGTLPTGACPTNAAPVFQPLVTSTALTDNNDTVSAQSVTGVFSASDSSIAFATYLPVSGAASTGAVLPAYNPAAASTAKVTHVTLASGATAPVFGVFASDNKTFFVGTAGDNKVHLITPSTLTDSSQLAPKLPSITTTGNTATPNLIVQYPRTVTNN